MSQRFKKVIPYLFLLCALVGVGFFSAARKTLAVAGKSPPEGTCKDAAGQVLKSDIVLNGCAQLSTAETWLPDDPPYSPVQVKVINGSPTSPTIDPNASEFEKLVNAKACWTLVNFDMAGCVAKLAYYGIFQVAAFFLWVSGHIFNFLVSIAFDSSMFTGSEFIPAAWQIVRDLSNVFFILMLLYVAFELILGLAHGAQKMIAGVIVMAFLINFSMFATGIVIDTSNILALIFYNKITVVHKDANGHERDYPESVANNEKDASGGIVGYFNPTKLMTEDFLKDASSRTVGGVKVTEEAGVSSGIILGIVLVSAAVMGFAAYAFFVTGFAFLGRLIELWLLIIASPFAFMSFAMPAMAGMKDWGFKAWSHRLLEASFMAPAFMFFLYLIFLLINSALFKGVATQGSNQSFAGQIVLFIIPAVIVLSLLLKSVKLAKASAGQFGDTVINLGKAVAGLTIGGAALAVGGVGRATVGAFMKGASTRDTAATRIQENRQILRDPNRGVMEKIRAGASIGLGGIQRITGLNAAQQAIGGLINRDQHNIQHAAHARHDLDEMAGKITHGSKKKWSELNGEERYEARRQIARDRVVRDNAGPNAAAAGTASFVPGLTAGFGNRKWDSLTTVERNLVDQSAAVGDDNGHPIHGLALENHTTVADALITQSRRKQGIISNIVQSSVGGTFDIRNLAKVIAKEQTTGMAKFASGLTGLIANGIRGGFKKIDIDYGTAQGQIFKDMATTITDALKSVKINVDLSHVGEVKKEDGHGGHH